MHPDRLSAPTLLFLATLTTSLATAPAAAQQAQLPAGVARTIESAPLDRAHWGIAVLDAATGQSLVAHNADRLFIPASNTKLVVAAAAAHYLDPAFHHVTSLESTARIGDGVLHGDLIVRGTGDPTISGRWTHCADTSLPTAAGELVFAVIANNSGHPMRPILDDIVRAVSAAF